METDPNIDTPDPNIFTDPSPNLASDAELATLCDVLKAHGVMRVIVQYEGCGDSGGVADVEYLPEGIVIPGPVDGNLRDVAVEYCPDGYENNDGGYGTLTVYLSDGLAELEHFDRFEDSQEMETSPADLPETLKQRLVGLGISFPVAGRTTQVASAISRLTCPRARSTRMPIGALRIQTPRQ